MIVRITPHIFSGTVRVPASKSHTIRQLLIASLADGISEILYPLDSLYTRSCLEACRVFGAEIEESYENDKLIKWTVKGGAKVIACAASATERAQKIDVGNSGTTLYLALAIAALFDTSFQFTGDEQIQKRSAVPLLDALAKLGIYVESNSGCAPITIKGPWKGGKVTLPCPTSQYLSAILIAAPLAPAGIVTEIEVPLLNEKPYVEMTLSYLKAHGIPYEIFPDFSKDDWTGCIVIPGGAFWKPFSSSVPGDFSSAAFPAAAAAITGGSVTLLGLDPEDTQGDKYFLEMLGEIGCDVEWNSVANAAQAMANAAQAIPENAVTISRAKPLKCGIFDLNKTPDLLPAAAAVAAFATGDTAFTNVAHARIKETDRIAVMGTELEKLRIKCTEKPDGLIVHGRGGLFLDKSALWLSPRKRWLSPRKRSPPVLDGHGDHRIVMALAVTALGAPFPVEIADAEAADVTYPEFLTLLSNLR